MDIHDKQSLTAYLAAGHRARYVFFWGHQESFGRGLVGDKSQVIGKSCFSQWYEAPFELGGNRYSTAEHYMMFQKARLFGDDPVAKKILLARTPGEAKALGREVSGFDEVLWQQHRVNIVIKGNLAKFGFHAGLREYLLNTGSRVLVEASPLDLVWGSGLAADHPDAGNPSCWRGQNLLGFALMGVRQRL